MNTITVYGRVASDVTTNNVNGRTVANFRFASQNKRKQQDGQYGTNFYQVAVWGAPGENVAKYLKKGHRACISGDLVIRQYVGSTDNQTHQAVEIDASSVDFVETKAEAEAKAGVAASQTAPALAPAPQGIAVVNTDDLPF